MTCLGKTMMIGLFSRKPPIKVKHDEVEIRLFDPKKDNWKEVRNMAFTPSMVLIPRVIEHFMVNPLLSSVVVIIAWILYQMNGSIWNPFIFMVGIYPTLYFFLLWKIP
ncbi:unnamed protein product, partial [Owenia fusiformis]